VRHLLIIFSIFLFSLTFISCSRSSDDGASTTSDNTTTTDTTPPTVSSSSPSDGDTSVSITSNVSVTFSETMDTSSVTTNTLDTSCFGTFQVSSDSFSSCVQMSSSPTSSNSDKTFTITPKDNLSSSTVYRIRITTGTKDSSGNSMTSQWNTSSGFKTSLILTEVTAVTTPTNDTTPNYTFSSSEAGTITYGGSCSSSTTSATSVNNTITLVSLSEGTYSNCTITVTDSAGNVSNTLTITTFTVDQSAATLAEVTVVTTPTNDNTPDYTFSSSEAGTITYGGSCSSSTTSATTDNNTITLVSLSDGTYSNCTITVTDNSSNSVTLNINSFIIDTTAPTVSSISPTENQSGVLINDNILVTFSEAMDNSSVTTNTDNTTCYGSFALSSDSFSNCIQMSSSPSSSNSYKTFTVDPSDNLSRLTTYKIRVTTGVKDTAGNTLSSQYETSSGFTITWTKQLGTTEFDSGYGVTVDSSDNIYVMLNSAGGFDSNTNLVGVYDIFLVKYNSSGTKQWTQQLGTTAYDFGYGVTVDSSDNIYVTGQTFGGLDGNTSSGDSDFFLVKYNSSGTKQWTRQLGTTAGDSAEGVTVDSSDNIYVTGQTAGGLDGNTNSGSDDLFLVKYNSSGTKQWTRQLGTSSTDTGYDVTVDSSDNIYITGSTFGGLDGNTHSVSNDIFLVKYNSSGIKQWTRQLGTSSEDRGRGVAVDASDNIYVTGYTQGGLDNNTSAGGGNFPQDIFLVKYNSSGTKQWTKQLGTSSTDIGFGVTVDNSSNIYVTGYSLGGLDGNTNLGSSDIILVKYNSSGTKQWTKQLGTSAGDTGRAVALDSSDNIYVTGGTVGGMDGNTSSGGADIFLVKYNSDGVKQ